MDTVQSYKCPCCGDTLVFNGSSQTFHCDSCENDFELAAIQQLNDAESSIGDSKYDWESYEPREFDAEETQSLSGYTCPSCGAEITGDDTLGATVCPYCGNGTIVKSQFEGALRPDYVIPFKVDKNAAITEFEKAYKKAPFLPDEFKDKKRIAEMAGVYVPFWMFDCDCNASITYDAERINVWSDSEYNYTKTDHYRLYRKGSIGFANIPVDGSKKADDDYMEAVEPFDYNDATTFNSAYLSGYLADKYDVSAEESITRANERVKNSTESAFAVTTGGYTSAIPVSSSVNFTNGKIRYAMLPVWMLNIKYNNDMFKYAINGQTGKVVGEYPVCKKKRNIYFAIVYLITLVIAIAGAWLYLK